MVHRRPRKLLADYLVTVHVLNKSLLTSAYPAAIPKRNAVERPQRQLSGLTPQCLIVPLAICDSQTSKVLRLLSVHVQDQSSFKNLRSDCSNRSGSSRNTACPPSNTSK